MEPTGDDDPEDIFHNALASVFGDAAVSHGEPGGRFCYNSPHGYLPSAAGPFRSMFPARLCTSQKPLTLTDVCQGYRSSLSCR